MAIMVHSFRDSVERWLGNILPADLYVRSNANLGQKEQSLMQSMAGVSRVNFLRSMEISLQATQPNITIVGRSFDDGSLNEALPFTGPVQTMNLPSSTNTIAVYISEAMVDLYQWQIGQTIASPINSQEIKQWFVAGIWRDYGRQHGTVAMALSDLARITGNSAATDAALWKAPNTSSEQITQELKKLNFLNAAEFRSSESIRTISLKVFDRSFALTYIIEAIAIAVALFGVASVYGADSLSRKREFATLAHIGVSSTTITLQVAIEALLGLLVAVIWGAIVGIGLAWILIRRINPQSFHWSMDFSWPVGLLLSCSIALILLGVVSALLAYRSSITLNAVQAIRS